ncbi:aminodeoxychorismate lyase ABZ2 SCDLUD_004739 [Saccharomycodes ludwigii]|uniref:aminodeoxychorismate lyase ABZ2 n=1 Tax=Saccharomycodes ludwigii TaxID=36035 RepID=UPI001E850481|nr:hypothetical protein SCDLUD_004739 [Saccharomycodes ludwigii]KAH3899302.1 hypothetical protein SCDLUD_004739 [Saccharomycodes ludwigii]
MNKEELVDIVERKVIDANYNYNNVNSTSDFEILTTIRYDPYLSKSYDCISDNNSNIETLLESIGLFLDPKLILSSSNSIAHETETIINPDDNNKTSNNKDLMSIYYQRFFLLGEHLKRINFTLQYFNWDYELNIHSLLVLLVQALPSKENTEDVQKKMNILLDDDICYKMRVLINRAGQIKIEAHVLPLTLLDNKNDREECDCYILDTLFSGFVLPTSKKFKNSIVPPIYTVYIDTEPLIPSPFTSFKTTKRQHYNRARERMLELHKGKEGPCEILVYNTNYEVMETSFCNVYFKKYVANNKDDTAKDCSSYYYYTPSLSSGCLCGTMRYYLLRKKLVSEVKSIDVRKLKDGDEVLLSNAIRGCFKGLIVKS